MIYEERRTLTHAKSAEDYLEYYKSDYWPKLRADGGQPICLLSGLIGNPANRYLHVTGFEDTQGWEAAQSNLAPSPPDLVEKRIWQYRTTSGSHIF